MLQCNVHFVISSQWSAFPMFPYAFRPQLSRIIFCCGTQLSASFLPFLRWFQTMERFPILPLSILLQSFLTLSLKTNKPLKFKFDSFLTHYANQYIIDNMSLISMHFQCKKYYRNSKVGINSN